MATSGGTLPRVRPSTSQVSNGHFAARCRVFQGKKQKLLKDATLIKAQKQSESYQVRSNMNFKFSASPVPTPALITAGQTVLATRIKGRNSVSYFHYLQRKMKLILSQVDSYQRELEKIIRLLRRKIDAYTLGLSRLLESTRMIALGLVDDYERAFQQFNAELVIFNKDLKRRINLLLALKDSRDQEIRRQIELLNSKLAPFAQELDMQHKLLDLKTASYNQSLNKKMMILKSRYCAFAVYFGSEFTYFDI